MRRASVIATACCVFVSGCNRSPEAAASGSRSPGRFAGIGVFDAGRLWAEMKGSPSQADVAAARLEDDEHVIVVLDSHTGETRQCGDHTGFCVSMNPWTGAGAQVALPAKLTKHASDLAEEDKANAKQTAQ